MKQGWTYKKLNEVCDKGSSNIVINKLEDNNGDYPLFGASGLVKNVDFYHQDKPYIGIVKDGAGVGRVNTYPAFSSLVGTMQYIFAKENCLLDFIKYFLIKLDLSHCVSGATIPHIYFKDYGKERIPVPSIDVQQSIVDELDKINQLISLKKAQLIDYDNLAQSIFYDMFGDPIENEKGWEVKMLGEVGEIISGSTPSTSDTENWNGDINWVTPAELGEQLYYGETVRKLTEKGAKGLTLMPVGTVLLSSRAPIGKLAITKVPMCCNQGFKNIICNSSVNNIFLYYYLLQTIEHVKSLGRGATFKEVSKSSLFSYKIITPPIYLQQCFATRILSIEQQKIIVNSSIKELETLLASRMQYWFG